MELRIVRHRVRDEIGGGKPGGSQKYLLPFNLLLPRSFVILDTVLSFGASGLL